MCWVCCGLEGAQQEEVILVLVLVVFAIIVVVVLVHVWSSGLLDERNHRYDSLTPFLVLCYFLQVIISEWENG